MRGKKSETTLEIPSAPPQSVRQQKMHASAYTDIVRCGARKTERGSSRINRALQIRHSKHDTIIIGKELYEG